jgi:hypothetical protein
MIPQTAIAAIGNPKTPMAAAQSGEKTMPPTFAPLYATASAAGRSRPNQGETIALTAAIPIVTQPSTGEEGCGEELSWRRRIGPTNDAQSKQEGTCFRHRRNAEAPAECRPRSRRSKSVW